MKHPNRPLAAFKLDYNPKCNILADSFNERYPHTVRLNDNARIGMAYQDPRGMQSDRDRIDLPRIPYDAEVSRFILAINRSLLGYNVNRLGENV